MRVAILVLISLLASYPARSQPVLRGRQGNYLVTEFVATTPQRAWDVLTDFNSQAQWAPDISQTKVIKRNGTIVELKQVYRAAYTFGLPIQAHLRIQETPPKSFSYQMIQGDRLNNLNGRWTITSMQGGVKLTHQIQVNPQVPGPLQPFYYEKQEQNLRQWMTVLKRRMELN